MVQPDRGKARRLAGESLAKGDAVGWFDRLYSEAEGNASLVPWADLCANPHLATWLAKQDAPEADKRSLVVGCGLGDDAESLQSLGYRVTAFDVSAAAIEWCRRRFAGSNVDYCVADLLRLPNAWRLAFDLVVEVYTLQVLPPELRRSAAAEIAACVRPGGSLVVIARGRELSEDRGAMPWPLSEDELEYFASEGLVRMEFEDFFDDEQPPVCRFRARFLRPA
jgi:SAM-dependent methyltransferase